MRISLPAGLTSPFVCALALGGCNDDGFTLADSTSSATETSEGDSSSDETSGGSSGTPTATSIDPDTDVDPDTTVDPDTSVSTTETGPDESSDTSESSEGSEGSESTGAPGPILGDPLEIPLDVDFDALAMDVADFDGDNNLDVLVTGVYASNVTAAVLYGDGDGTFGAPSFANIAGCSAYPAVGDLGVDGRADVVMGGCGVPLVVWQGLDGGGFGPWVPWSEEQYPGMRANLVGDFGYNNVGDLFTLRVITGPATPSVWIERSYATNDIYHTTSADLGPDFASGFDPDAMFQGDLANDYPTDLVLLDRGNAIARVMGSGADGDFWDAQMIDTDVPPWTVVVEDVDGDSVDDVVVVSYGQESLQVLHNQGDATFVADPPVALGAFDPYDAAAGDVDGDGARDIVVVDDGQAWITLAQNDGDGGLVVVETRDLPAPAIRMHVSDLDGNGRADVIAGTLSAGSITVLLTP